MTTPTPAPARVPASESPVVAIARWLGAPAIPLASLYLARLARPIAPLDLRLVGLLAVTVAAALCGVGPGLLSAAETVVAVEYLDGPPLTGALLADPRLAAPLGLFALTTFVVALAAGAWREARRVAATRRTQLARAERELAVLRREAQERATEIAALQQASAAAAARLRTETATAEAAARARTSLIESLPPELRESQLAAPEAISLFPPMMGLDVFGTAAPRAEPRQLTERSAETDPAD